MYLFLVINTLLFIYSNQNKNSTAFYLNKTNFNRLKISFNYIYLFTLIDV